MEGELVSDSLSDGGEGESKKEEPSLFAYTNYFYKCLPYYIAIGMTPDEFWNQDCTLTRSYQEAFKIKKELQNELLWLQGMYNYEALCDILPSVVSLGKCKPQKYSVEPYPVTKQEAERREYLKEQKRFLKMKAKVQSVMDSINKKFKKEEKQNDGDT